MNAAALPVLEAARQPPVGRAVVLGARRGGQVIGKPPLVVSLRSDGDVGGIGTQRGGEGDGGGSGVGRRGRRGVSGVGARKGGARDGARGQHELRDASQRLGVPRARLLVLDELHARPLGLDDGLLRGEGRLPSHVLDPHHCGEHDAVAECRAPSEERRDLSQSRV